MTLVEAIFYKDFEKYLQVRIWTACCKTRFIVKVEGNNLVNMTTGEYVLPGMVKSIKQAERYHEDEMLQMRKRGK